ncbi:uncharacterized protein LOC122058910 isoform X2 [Macadamia integrifolia]|uniref:uncharacterized protein LOC122058910 isoform X2 n=1 Tax=Macadamia integrifolia TaxID=60698 RepID=UPI001C527C1F|nr:uncharacterized protein LOC122058910 isoform X2 [Macadamia integrifolia]
MGFTGIQIICSVVSPLPIPPGSSELSQMLEKNNVKIQIHLVLSVEEVEESSATTVREEDELCTSSDASKRGVAEMV